MTAFTLLTNVFSRRPPVLVVQLFVVEDLDIGVEGFRAIAALSDLRSLTLTSCDGIDRSGLELLCGLSSLQYLDMSDVWEFAGDTLQPLASLTTLQAPFPRIQQLIPALDVLFACLLGSM